MSFDESGRTAMADAVGKNGGVQLGWEGQLPPESAGLHWWEA